MPQLDPKSASVALLGFLEKLPGSPFGSVNKGLNLQSHKAKYTGRRQMMSGYRKDIEYLTKALDKAYWIIETLQISMDEIRQAQPILLEKRAATLRKANQLAATDPRPPHLPNEVLSLIAEYVLPRPITLAHAVQLNSSGRKWDKYVLKSSLIKLDRSSLKFPSLTNALSASSPAKLLIILDHSQPVPEDAINALVPFRARWHSVDVGIGPRRGDLLSKAVFALACPNCPTPRVDSLTECKDHTVLSSLYNLSLDYQAFPPVSWLKNIRRVSITVTSIIGAKPVDFSGLAAGAPSLSELAVYWKARSHLDPAFKGVVKTLFPKLRKVVFVQGKDLFLQPIWLKLAFGSLDCTRVEYLSLYTVDDTEDIHGEDEMMDYLGTTFPLVRSFEVRAIPGVDFYPQEKLYTQIYTLDELAARSRFTKADDLIFPRLIELSVELDLTEGGLNTLLNVLHGGHDHSGPALRDIRSLNLYTESYQFHDSLDFFGKIRARVKHITICSPHPLIY